MTYRSLKSFINKNTQEHNSKIFDLMPHGIKSKIIFVVGNGASNTAALLTSIMSACEIKYFHYLNDNIYINKKFLQNGLTIPMELLCDNAEAILKATKKAISNEDLFFNLALSFCNNEYAIIEISEEYYSKIKDNISPYAIIFTNEDSASLIENAHKDVKEIISLSYDDDFDYISTKTNKNGTRITLASPNKITISNSDLFGTSFYHYSYLYHISALDLNNASLAHLAIESASVLFSTPRPYIYKGLENAKVPHDFILYSLSPTVLLYEGENNFKLHHRLKFKTVTENDIFEIPTKNTIFCGSKEYLEQIKQKL